MSIFDNANKLVNKGVADAQRTARTVTIKNEIKSLEKQRETATARLGDSLFPELKDNAAIREPREALFSTIEAIDMQINRLRADLASIEMQGRVSNPNATICEKCGSSVSKDDNFCLKCGAPIPKNTEETSSEEPKGPVCQSCGTVASEGQQFCIRCGNKLAVEDEESVEGKEEQQDE